MEQVYTTLKVPKDFRRSADIVRSRVAQRGLNNLPAEFRSGLADKYCPFCHREMVPTLHVKMAHTCPECRFSKPVLEVTAPTARANGVLAAIGAAALIGLSIYFAAKLVERSEEEV